MRQLHVLFEPAESNLFWHHAALDRVTELWCVVHVAHDGPPTTTRNVTRHGFSRYSAHRASNTLCGCACSLWTKTSKPSAFINFSSPICMALDKASPRKTNDFRHQRQKLMCFARRLFDMEAKLPLVKRCGVPNANAHALSRLFIIMMQVSCQHSNSRHQRKLMKRKIIVFRMC